MGFLKILAKDPQKASTRSNPIVRRLGVTTQEPTHPPKTVLEFRNLKKRLKDIVSVTNTT